MFLTKLTELYSWGYLFFLIFLCILNFTYSQTNNGMTMQFLFDGPATNTGSLSGSSTLTTLGTPTLNSAVSVASGKKSVFFNNPNKGSSMSTNYYKASNSHSAPISVMLWFRTDLSYGMTVLGLHHTSCTGAETYTFAFQLDIGSNGVLTLHIALPSQWSHLYTTIQPNTWTHIAFTVSSSYVGKLYKNGVYITQATGTSNFPANSFQSLFIGGSGDCFRGFHGYIQDLRMYNRELPANEIFNITFPNNTYFNSVTNILTVCPVGSNSTGSGCTCVGNTYFNIQSSLCIACPVGSNSIGGSCLCIQARYYVNSQSNICIVCPVGSNSTGSGCTCVGNTYFNSVTSTCDPYFSDGVIGDAPWGIWRAQSYDAGTSLILRESRGNGRDITISGNISINNSSGNGALNPVYSLQGDTSSTMLWKTELTGDFTICSMTRYTGNSNRQRILSTKSWSTCDWLHGHHFNKRGVALYNSAWRTSSTTSRGTLTDWLVICGQNSASSSTAIPNNIITDGMYKYINYII